MDGLRIATFEAQARMPSYTDRTSAYVDLDTVGGYAQFGAKGPGASLGVKLRTILGGVTTDALTFAANAVATFAAAVTIASGGLTISSGTLAAQAMSGTTATFTGQVSITQSSGGVASLKVKTSSAANGAHLTLENTAGFAGAYRNWALATNYNTSGAFELIVGASEGANPLSGGTSVFKVTSAGAMSNITSLSLSGSITSAVAGGAVLQNTTVTTSNMFLNFSTGVGAANGGQAVMGVEGAAGSTVLGGASPYAMVIGHAKDKPIELFTNNTMVARWVSGGGLQFMNAVGALADGMLWYDGTNLKCRLGGVTKTITVS